MYTSYLALFTSSACGFELIPGNVEPIREAIHPYSVFYSASASVYGPSGEILAYNLCSRTYVGVYVYIPAYAYFTFSSSGDVASLIATASCFGEHSSVVFYDHMVIFLQHHGLTAFRLDCASPAMNGTSTASYLHSCRAGGSARMVAELQSCQRGGAGARNNSVGAHAVEKLNNRSLVSVQVQVEPVLPVPPKKLKDS